MIFSRGVTAVTGLHMRFCLLPPALELPDVHDEEVASRILRIVCVCARARVLLARKNIVLFVFKTAYSRLICGLVLTDAHSYRCRL